MPSIPPPLKKTNPLNNQMILFCEEYLIDPSSANQAAKRAGYKDYNNQGRILSQDERVKEYLEERREEISKRTGITPERVLRELARIAYFNLTDYLISNEDGDVILDLDKLKASDFASAIQEVSVVTTTGKVKKITTKLKPAEKLPALLTIGKHLDMFKQKVEVSGNVGLLQLIESSMSDSPYPKIIDTTHTEVPDDGDE